MTEDDVKIVEKFISIRNRGLYADGGQVTEVYNRVLNKNVRPTSCGSCIRQRVNELEVALNAYKRLQEALKNNDLDDTPSEENKAIVDANAGENKPPEKKVGRSKKQ